MEIVMFGGSFNPPHRGHRAAALAAEKELQPDQLLIMPDYLPPHKVLAAGSPAPEQRLTLCREGFSGIPNAEISDLELRRGGTSYTADTLRALSGEYPGARLTLLVGTDMLLTLDQWREPEFLLKTARIRAFPRERDDRAALEAKAAELRARFGADVALIDMKPLPASSTDVRAALAAGEGVELLTDRVYAAIVRERLYQVKVNLPWLRRKAYAMLKPKRIPHVVGCEREAVSLARRWGADEFDAAVAAILHDCTKKLTREEQLRLCAKYGLEPDEIERNSEKLLHSKTGAAVALARFGVSEAVAEAIRWHTTGKADMTLLEKVIYLADYIEPTRAFPGVERLRTLAYEDLDAALCLGLEMSDAEVRSYGTEPHPNSAAALAWLRRTRGAEERA